MTGAEHRRKAEQLLEQIAADPDNRHGHNAWRATAAQAHAALALAAEADPDFDRDSEVDQIMAIRARNPELFRTGLIDYSLFQRMEEEDPEED